jgi:DNA-binding transcriptional ArsR family regulator
VIVVDRQRVRAVRDRLVSTDEAARVAEVFRVLGDPGRCRPTVTPIEAGELCVCDITATWDMTESDVSHHLRLLRDHGTVKGRRGGLMGFCSPDDDHIRLLPKPARDHLRHGEDAS